MDFSGNINFYGDPHGDFSEFRKLSGVLDEALPEAVIFLGDFDPDRSVAEEINSVLKGRVPAWLIHGNHDTDRPEWHDRVFDDATNAMNISRRTVEIDGIKIGGLGGIFREKVWHPKNGDGNPVVRTRDEFLQRYPGNSWKSGIALKHRSSIFPEDIEDLADLEADILVTHEAPSCHRHGFEDIDLIAECMGASLIVHGHHHEDYHETLGSGIEVIGTGKAGLISIPLAEIHAMKNGTPKP